MVIRVEGNGTRDEGPERVSPGTEMVALIRAFGVFYSPMPKPRPKITRTRPTKEVSVMAWIEDAEQKVLLVRQAVGLRLWTLPGGKVKRGESLVKALRRELYEETGLRAQLVRCSGCWIGMIKMRSRSSLGERQKVGGQAALWFGSRVCGCGLNITRLPNRA